MGRTNKMRISVISIILGILLIAFIGVATIVTNNQSQIAFAEPHDHSGWTAWTTTTSLPTAAGNYYLDVDVTLNPWCTDLLERHVQTYGDVTINVEYDDCNPFAMVAGDFGDMADLSLHTEQTASVSTLNYLNTLSERFNTFIGGYTIPKNGSSYVQNTNSDYANFYTSARSVYSTSVAQYISWSSDYSTYSAVIGANYPYVLKGDSVPFDLDYQLLLAKLFGFSDKTAFMECAQSLADVCAAYTLSPTNEALMNGCFYSNGNYIFPITSRNGVVSPVRMFVFVDANGYVSVWVDYIQNALQAVNFNADYYQSYYSTVDQGVIYNRLYCKNVLFITGSTASWKVPDGTKLCLNGHSITYQSFLRDGGTYASVIDASGSTFDLYDCDETVHYYYVDADQNGGGCGVVVDSEEAAIEGNPDKYGSFKGGYITGGTGTKHSRDNINSYYKGGAIFGDGTGTNVTMHGGTLIGNSGGIYTFDESGAVHVSRGTFRMTGGNIIGNFGTAVNVEGPKNTSGTYCYLEGGVIRHNSGGVLAHGQYQSEGYGDANLYIGGPIEIYDNFTQFQDYDTGIWYRQEKGITLGWGAMIGVDNPLQNEHPIPVSGVYGQFTYGLQGNGGAENFTSTGGYLVTLTNQGEAQFVEACRVTYNANGATSGTAPVDNNVYLPGDKVTILGQGDLVKSGHTFGGWRISEWDETIYTEGQEITISYSMNFSAIWEHQPHDDVNFQTKWTAYDSLPTEAGNYYLVMPVQLNDTWIVPSGTTNLCLHGYGISVPSYREFPVIVVPEGSVLNIYDCDTTERFLYVENWRGQYVVGMNEEGLDQSGTGYVRIRGGYITGGVADIGGGIYINGGTVNLYGGSIAGNKANAYGGGVYVESGSFAMHGGKIAANKANNSGAGVFVDENGAMSLSGNVTISGNTTEYSDSNVYLSADKVITITGALTYETPIGVTLESRRAVFTNGWTDVMDDANPADYFASEDMTCEIILFEDEAKVYKEAHEHNGVEFEEWTSDYSLPASGNYYLTKDVTISSTTTVTGTLNLCLNGHGIIKTGNGSVFSVSSGKTLNVYDNTTTEHRFTVSNPKPNGAGVATVNDALAEGYQTFEGGYITGGTGGDGAGIRVYGTFNLYGGNVIGNNGTSGDANGGAIKMENGSAFTMYGGNIIYNHGRTGGALFVESNSVFTMMGGTIGYNVNSVRGAAFFTRGTVYIRGGEISNNYNNGEQAIALWGGTIEITGGVLSDNLNNSLGLLTLSTLSLGGDPVIKDNKDGGGNQANLYVKNGGVINIVGALDDSVKSNKIGVTLQNGAGVFASGWSTYMSGKDPADYFYSEAGYEILVIGTEAYVHQHTYGDLVERVNVTCDEDGMAAHYHCAECGKYFDENKDETAYDDLIIHTRGHAYQYHPRVDVTCTEYGKREHYTCARCGLYFNTNKQVIQSYTISIGGSGHQYDPEAITYTWTPDENASYGWKVTATYACTRCGEVVEKNAGIESKNATWNEDSGIRAYVYVNDAYRYSESKFRESDAGTATINKWTAWEYDDCLPNAKQPSDSQGWYLTKDVVLTDTWTVPATGLKLCLNGHVIAGNFDTSKTVIYVPKGVKFELYEYDYTETHYYYIGKTVTDSHNNTLNFVGQIVDSEEDPNYIAAARKGSFTGGYVTGGTGRVVGSNTYGGAVYIDGDASTAYYNCGEFNVYGGTLFGNYADFGGAVYVATRAYLYLSSGNVIGNQAGSEGGGIYANERAGYNSSRRDGNAGARSYGGNILYNTAGQSGNGYGGGVAGWVELDYCTVQGNSAIGANAKGGAVYGFFYLESRPTITENYTTGFGPGVYVTNYNMRVGSSANFKINGNRYVSSVTVEQIETTGHGDLYFGSGYTFTIYSNYPPSGTDGYKAFVEMQSGTGNFTTQWIEGSYKKYFDAFAALPGYKITLSGNTLSLQTSGGDYTVDTSKQIVIYSNYYYLNGTTTSATTFTTDENHRYVFSGTRTLTTNIALYGNRIDTNDIYLRFNNLDLTAPSNSGYIFYAYPYYGPLNIHIELVGDSVLHSSGIYTAFYGGSYQYPLNIYFTGSGTITFVDTAENGTGNAFGKYSGREAHAYVGGVDISVYEIVKEKIAEIGLEVTFTKEIKERIDVARAAYDALDDSLKGKVTNYPVLEAAELAYKIAAVQGAIDMIEAIPDVYTIESNASIFLAREAYDALDNEELKGLLETEDPQALVYNRQKLFDAEASIIFPMKATAEGCEVDYDGEAHGIIVTPEVEGATIKYGTQEGEYTLDECPTYTDVGTYTIYYEVTKTNYSTVTGSAVVTIRPVDVIVTITGNNSTVDYDGEEHTVSGYEVVFDNALYTVNDFTFSGNATATQTNAGTAYMGLLPSQFANTNGNFNVEFTVTDGYVTVDPINVIVTITGNKSTFDYDGEEHTVTGYLATAGSALYDVTNDFTFNGTALATQTNAGTANMNLAASQFTNTNANFATVTFNVTDGYVTVNPINVTVTITGHNSAVDYDGEEHTVTGYEVEFGNSLYTKEDFTFTGTATAAQTNAGTAYMELAAEQFVNNNNNFVTVIFNVTDGYVTIQPIDATVTITGHKNTADYDGTEHTTGGYDTVCSTTLYTENDFSFNGTAAKRTNVGTTNMGLTADLFENTSPNFATVTFIIAEDGYQTITPIDATVTITGKSNSSPYDGTKHTISGYDAEYSTPLYTENDFTFSGDATVKRTNAGTTNMNLTSEMFENTSANFDTVTFVIAADGYQTITPISATVTITGRNATADYDGTEHSISGYDVEYSTTLYTKRDFTFKGEATAKRTDAGTTNMNLTSEMFKNTNKNFETVTFVIAEDGYQTITPISATVTITGRNATSDYDGTEHTISGYDVTYSTALYTENNFTFSGEATAKRTDAGTTNMDLTADLFENTSMNFAMVTFVIAEDGYQTITPISATVTITGRNDTADYDGTEHTISGYDVTYSTALYTENDFTFSGEATAKRTDAGTTNMALTVSQFVNINDNFAMVTFEIVDGYFTVETVDSVVTKAPEATNPTYTEEECELVSAGEAEGGTLYYALGADEGSAPAGGYLTTVPVAKEVGTYYVWYKVIADGNHNDTDPVCVKVVLSEVTLDGIIYQKDGATPVYGAVVTLVKGNMTIDSVTTEENGRYHFSVAAGVYNIVAEYAGAQETIIILLFENTEKDVVFSGNKTESKLEVKTTEEDEDLGVAVGGLEQEAQDIREENPDAESVSVVMIVEPKVEEAAKNADTIAEQAEDKSLAFFEIKVEKRVDSVTTMMEETNNIMEIAIPYAKINKRGLIVYSCHNDSVRTFVESDTKADGTFRVDKENKLIYVYANKFSTYAIGYTPYYRLQTALSLGSYTGKANVTIINDADANIVFTLKDANTNNIIFPDVPKGQYTMTVTWEDGKTNTLTMTLTVGPKTVLSVKTEQAEMIEEAFEEPSEAANAACTIETEETEIIEIEVVATAAIEDSGYETDGIVDVAITNKKRKICDEVCAILRKRDEEKEL